MNRGWSPQNGLPRLYPRSQWSTWDLALFRNSQPDYGPRERLWHQDLRYLSLFRNSGIIASLGATAFCFVPTNPTIRSTHWLRFAKPARLQERREVQVCTKTCKIPLRQLAAFRNLCQRTQTIRSPHWLRFAKPARLQERREVQVCTKTCKVPLRQLAAFRNLCQRTQTIRSPSWLRFAKPARLQERREVQVARKPARSRCGSWLHFVICTNEPNYSVHPLASFRKTRARQ